MNFKSGRGKQARSGCFMCKPNKLGRGNEHTLGHKGFGKLRSEEAARQELKMVIFKG